VKGAARTCGTRTSLQGTTTQKPAMFLLKTVAQMLLREKELFMFSGILFSKVISTLIKVLKCYLTVFSGIACPDGISRSSGYNS
jgi:hypothetical protein